MKRYLMNAAVAFVLGGMMVSCSDDNVDFVSIANQKAQAFEKVFNDFAAEYGGINPNNNWGFTDDRTIADTTGMETVVTVEDEMKSALLQNRAALLDGIRAKTRSVWANGNEWADPKGGNWAVPPALTDRQKEIVRMYFQNVPNPSYTDPGWTNYFMQQVYKGGTNPGPNSTEAYTAADGYTQIVGSNNMDHLAAVNGDFVDHINNFNHGDCGTYYNVLDNENNGVNEGPWHSDKINLMTSSTTVSFGYYNSNSSVRRTEYTGLVSWETIYDWAVKQGISDANVLDDGWNRSYMGFDFEMLVGDEIFSLVLDYSAGWDPNLPNGFPIKGYNCYREDIYGQKYPYLSAEMNMYCGTLKEFNDEPSDEEVAQLLADGYLPVISSADKKWVKVGGTADGYYSDWIVTLTEAKKKDGSEVPEPVITTQEKNEETYEITDSWYEVTGQEGRVFCEDLGTATREDLDYNDVVFDVHIWEHYYKKVVHYWKDTYTYTDGQQTGYKREMRQNDTTIESTDNYAEVILKAAGGTLPLQVAGKEVHEAFGVGVTTMVNTRDGNSTAFGSFVSADEVAIGDETKVFTATDGKTYTKKLTRGYRRAIDVPIVVNYDGNAVNELQANQGKAPHKLLVPLGTPWATERKNLALGYPDFGSYINDSEKNWTNNRVSAYLYDGNTASTETPTAFRTVRVINSSDDILWSATATFGSSWTLQSQNISLSVDKFWPGDILRFHCKNIPATSTSADTDNQAWINIYFGDGIGQVFDGQVLNYDPNSPGATQSSTSCVEILISEALAEKMNSAISGGGMQITVAGRNFTLDRVARKPFDK